MTCPHSQQSSVGMGRKMTDNIETLGEFYRVNIYMVDGRRFVYSGGILVENK